MSLADDIELYLLISLKISLFFVWKHKLCSANLDPQS